MLSQVIASKENGMLLVTEMNPVLPKWEYTLAQGASTGLNCEIAAQKNSHVPKVMGIEGNLEALAY